MHFAVHACVDFFWQASPKILPSVDCKQTLRFYLVRFGLGPQQNGGSLPTLEVSVLTLALITDRLVKASEQRLIVVGLGLITPRVCGCCFGSRAWTLYPAITQCCRGHSRADVD